MACVPCLIGFAGYDGFGAVATVPVKPASAPKSPTVQAGGAHLVGVVKPPFVVPWWAWPAGALAIGLGLTLYINWRERNG